MTSKLTPDQFRFQLLEHAHAIRRDHQRDDRFRNETRVWLIRMEAWREFRMSRDYVDSFAEVYDKDGVARRELLGFPVRITYEDVPDAPMIQLLVEPKLRHLRRVV